MKSYAGGRVLQNKKESLMSAASKAPENNTSAFSFVDNRPGVVAQRKLQETSHVNQQNLSIYQRYSEPRQENNTGLPDSLKTGVQQLSGYSMDDVKVHYNSSKPAQLNAYAYAQGSNIHLSPGQEKQLPHEAWHVVQQKQGRVKSTAQLAGKTPVNNDQFLEREADIMGDKALKFSGQPDTSTQRLQTEKSTHSEEVSQLREIGLFGLEAEVIGERLNIISLDMPEDDTHPILSDPNVVLEEYSLGQLSGSIKITTDNEAKRVEPGVGSERSYTVEFIQHPVDILGDSDSLMEAAMDWQKAAALWAHLFDQKDSGTSFSTLLEQHPDVTIEKNWESPRFGTYEGNPNITTNNTSDGKKHSLDWTNLAPELNVKSKDPEVSPQLTAGASLLALEKSYLATLQPLAFSKSFDSQRANQLNFKHPENAQERGKMQSMELIKLMTRYIRDSRKVRPKQKRYGKEYVHLMSRTSLDSIFRGMSSEGRSEFLRQSVYYMKGQNNDMQRLFNVLPSAPVIGQAAKNEDQASQITVEQLLLSILNLKRTDTNSIGFTKDTEAAGGDAFSQAGVSGLSEIEPGSDYNINRFGLDQSDEMMKGIKGVIFENRLAKAIPLSEMPTLFLESAKALKLVESRMQHEKDKLGGLVPVSEVRDITPVQPPQTGIVEERNVPGVQWANGRYSGHR